MTDNNLLTQAHRFLDGKDFFIDWMYDKRRSCDNKVICYTIDGQPDYIKVSQFQQMINPANQHL